MIERIEYEGRLFAIIVPANHRDSGIHFFTPDDFSQQLAYMRRPTGHLIEPHIHNAVPREVVYTQEVLFIRSGRLRVDFYDDARNWVESRELGPGDVILLAAGGHGFEVLDEAEIIEVKQGPFAGDRDKTRFEGKGRGDRG